MIKSPFRQKVCSECSGPSSSLRDLEERLSAAELAVSYQLEGLDKLKASLDQLRKELATVKPPASSNTAQKPQVRRSESKSVEYERGWVIYDTSRKRLYVPRLWDDQATALKELAVLIRPYPMDNPWRKRLIVKEHARVKKAKASGRVLPD